MTRAEIIIGYWIVSEPEERSFCPSYYAADWEQVELKPGKYPLVLTFVGGYTIPMPKTLRAKIDAKTVAGKLYSGFGGVNFASRDIAKGPTTYHFSAYGYQIHDLVKNGRAELLPEFEDILDHKYPLSWVKEKGWDWPDIRKMEMKTG